MFKLVLGAILVVVGVGSMFWGCSVAVATAFEKGVTFWGQLTNGFFLVGVTMLLIGAVMCGWEKE